MIYTERQTGRKYWLIKIYSEVGKFMNAHDLRRYDIVKRYV